MSRILHPTSVMISDIHVGDPESPTLEDFDRDDDFARLLADVIPARTAGSPATLIIAGDFIDFPQILPELGRGSRWDRLGTTEDESVRRIERAITGHPRVFAALGDFVARGNQVLVLPGNHDVDLFFPRVFAALRAAVGDPPPAAFAFVPEGFVRAPGVHIEHGNQHSYDNWFEHWDDPVRAAPEGPPRIERPWGTLFMDLVYNDIEDAYPFVNKVYPHEALARIVLRLVRDDPKVSVPAIARLLAFFVTRGKRSLAERLMGRDDGAGDAEGGVSLAEVEAAVDDLGGVADAARRAALVAETARLTGAAEDAEPGGGDAPVPGLLGRTDERGLDARAREILMTGTVGVVAFGHTHAPVDGKPVHLPGRVGRVFNTGGWIPRIVVADGATPSLGELAAARREHDLRYLVLELGGEPRAVLERLPT
jgi:hypothetical protein